MATRNTRNRAAVFDGFARVDASALVDDRGKEQEQLGDFEVEDFAVDGLRGGEGGLGETNLPGGERAKHVRVHWVMISESGFG